MRLINRIIVICYSYSYGNDEYENSSFTEILRNLRGD